MNERVTIAPVDHARPNLRSLLFVPGNRTALVAKAVAAGADGIIVDLEDAVPAAARADARSEVTALLCEPPAVPLFVRINSLRDPAALDDLTAVVGRHLTGVLIPKVGSVTDVQVADQVVTWLELKAELRAGLTCLVPILETAEGMRQAYAIACASARCAYMGGLGVKGGDVARSLGYRWTPVGTETLAVRSQLLLDVRAAGVPNPITGTWTDVTDLDGLRIFAEQSRNLGYEGMLAIHPAHVPVINAAFTPSEAELDADERLVAAVEDAARRGAGAVVHDGDAIDEAMAATSRSRLVRYRPAAPPD